MTLPERKHSLRYPGFDYASPAGIFVTVVTHQRQPLFGEVIDGQLQPSPAGLQVSARWNAISHRFPSVHIDEYIVMPDHIHGVLWMGAADAENQPLLGDVIRWLKSAVVSDYAAGVRDLEWDPYQDTLWQRGYHDHIVRGERDLHAIREYIAANPSRWGQTHT